MRLRPHLRVLARGVDEVQVGTDDRWAVRLTDLGPGERDLLLELAQTPDLALWARRAPAHAVGVDRVHHLTRLLVDAQVTCGSAERGTSVRGGAGGDVAAWSLLRGDGDGDALVRARRDRVVGVVGLGRLGLTVASTLATSGVGTILLDDGIVTSCDVGIGGYRMADVGSSRSAAAARALKDVAPDLRCDAPSGTEPDVVVLVERGAANPSTALSLVTAGIAHLSVVVREADALVGPFVVPAAPGTGAAGGGACLRCLDLHRADVDPAWPMVAAQLVGRTVRPGVLSGEPAALGALCAALAAADVLAHLDGRSPRTCGATYEVAMPDLEPRLRHWAVHPDCGCTALPRSAEPVRAR